MTNAVMFGPEGNNLLPAQQLYKKNILALTRKLPACDHESIWRCMRRQKKCFFLTKELQKSNTHVIFRNYLGKFKI